MSAPQALIGGRYRLVRRIAAGGMGVVWEGWDEVLERPVAIKQLRIEVGVTEAEAERAKSRAMREARITARLHHPHAVPVFDAVKHEGQPWLVMQYLPSTTLSAVLHERGPLAPAEVVRIGAQVASALAAAHRLKIVHRDVKPGNILLTEDGDALISDFGISHALGDATLTSTGLVHGTPAFLAPEVARGAQAGFPSDVFSLGATLYAATEGAPPFGMDPNSIALLHKVAAGRFPPPVRSGALTRLLLEMLDGDPDARPPMSRVASGLASLDEEARAEERARVATVAPVPPEIDRGRPDEGDEGHAANAASASHAEEAEPEGSRPDSAVPDDLTLLAAAFEHAADDPPQDAGDRLADEAGPREESQAPRAAAEDPERLGTGPDSRTAPSAAPSSPVGAERPSAPAAAATAAPAAPPQEDPGAVEPLPWFVARAPGADSRAAGSPTGEPPSAVAPTAGAESTPAPIPERRPAGPGRPPADAGTRDRTRRLSGILLITMVAALALLGGALLVGRLVQPVSGDEAGQGPAETVPPSASAGTPSAPASTGPPGQQSPVPSSAPSPMPEPAPLTREQQLAGAVSGYYALMPGNTDAAWPLMTADYQTDHAGGRAAYERFWDAVSEVSVGGIRGIAPDAAEATVTYRFTDGRVVDELTAYRFVDEGGTLKIAATSVISSVTR